MGRQNKFLRKLFPVSVHSLRKGPQPCSVRRGAKFLAGPGCPRVSDRPCMCVNTRHFKRSTLFINPDHKHTYPDTDYIYVNLDGVKRLSTKYFKTGTPNLLCHTHLRLWRLQETKHKYHTDSGLALWRQYFLCQTCMHIHIHRYIYIHNTVSIHTCRFTYINVHTHTYRLTYIHTYIHTYIAHISNLR